MIKTSEKDQSRETLPSTEESKDILPNPASEILVNISDVYNTRYIKSQDLPSSVDEFNKRLDATITQFRKDQVKGVYLELSLDQFTLIGPAKDKGFTFHHAEGSIVTMQYWVAEGQSRLPHFASHYVGVGGLVIDWENGKVLVIKEKSGHDVITWKVPGGLVDTGEYVGEAAEREVREETGILTTFKGVIAVREKKNYNFGRNDIYIVCLLEPKTTEINFCQLEISTCKWMDINEWAKQDFKVGTQELICKMAQEMIHSYKNSPKDSKHLEHVWQSTLVDINLASFKGKHLAYVPSHFVNDKKEIN